MVSARQWPNTTFNLTAEQMDAVSSVRRRSAAAGAQTETELGCVMSSARFDARARALKELDACALCCCLDEGCAFALGFLDKIRRSQNVH